MMRTSEVDRISGIPYYIAAALLVIFPQPIAILSVLYLAFGDPVASLCGILCGKYGPDSPAASRSSAPRAAS